MSEITKKRLADALKRAMATRTTFPSHVAGYIRRRTEDRAPSELCLAEITLIIDIVEAGGRWLVRLAENGYAEHAKHEEARREALNLADEARQFGRDVEVWDRPTGKRLL